MAKTITRKKENQLAPEKESTPVKLILTNYHNNTETDYTEKIEALDRAFNYQENSQMYWNQPEFSLLYGTPLYNQSTESQKIALNHLYWYLMYHFTATSEHQTIVFNTITAGVFKKIPGYEMVAQTLELESKQEISHIHAFRKVCYQLIKALLGKDAFKETYKPKPKIGYKEKLEAQLGKWKNSASRFLMNQMLKDYQECYSDYLKELEEQDKLPHFNSGFIFEGMNFNLDWVQFFSQHWGKTPFLACNYYTMRYIANMGLKQTEHTNFKYYRELESKGEKIAAPTAICYYHFLDESFHTSTSRFMARELYRDFPKPTAYEKLIANLVFYRQQKYFLSGLSAVIPDKHRPDNELIMGFVYKVLQSPLFGFNESDALEHMEQCFCQEHDGLHLNHKFHQMMLSEFQRTYGKLEYLWPVNREMRLMEQNNSIEDTIKKNKQTFAQFQQMISQ